MVATPFSKGNKMENTIENKLTTNPKILEIMEIMIDKFNYCGDLHRNTTHVSRANTIHPVMWPYVYYPIYNGARDVAYYGGMHNITIYAIMAIHARDRKFVKIRGTSNMWYIVTICGETFKLSSLNNDWSFTKYTPSKNQNNK